MKGQNLVSTSGVAMQCAVKSKEESIVSLLLVQRAEVDLANKEYGFIALRLAVYRGDRAIVQLLINNGMDPNFRSYVNHLNSFPVLHIVIQL